MLKFLVEEGAPIEVVDEIKWSALHHAAGNGYAAIIRYLVEQGTMAAVKIVHRSIDDVWLKLMEVVLIPPQPSPSR